MPPHPGKGPVVAALGNRLAGDDGVGPAVLDALRPVADLDLIDLGSPLSLVEALVANRPVWVVDAALDGLPPGTLCWRVVTEHHAYGRRASSHGGSLPQALGVARRLGAAVTAIPVIAISIGRATPGVATLSPAVAAAVPRAAEVVALAVRAGRTL